MTEPSSPTPQNSNVRLMAVAVGVGILAVILVNVYVSREREGRREREITIYRLNRSLSIGDKLKARDVDAFVIPRTYAQAFGNAVTDEPGVDKERRTVRNWLGKRLIQPAPQNSVLTYSLFSETGSAAGQLMPKKGFRLVALPVKSRTLVGALKPGAYVDIEAPFRTGGTVPRVMPVLEFVEVLALGTRTVNDEAEATSRRRSRQFRTITIQVRPWEATYLSMIEKLAAGDFELHLRNPDDPEYPKIKSPSINREVLNILSKAVGGRLPGPALVEP